jgi:PAS domain S-box-containing protein
MMASVFLLDKEGEYLLLEAAPSLPKAYNAAINKVKIGPGAGSYGTAAFTKQPVMVADIAKDPLWKDFKDIALRQGIHACWSTPIFIEEKLLGTFAMYYRKPHAPTANDKLIIDFATRTVALVIERHRAAAALTKSEKQLRNLFNSYEDGFCTIEVIFDDNNNAVDYIFREVNHAFEKQTGIEKAGGKRMKDVAPDHEQYWFDIYGKVALSQETIRFEREAKALNRWYEVYAFPIDSTEKNEVGVVFRDISDQKKK